MQLWKKLSWYLVIILILLSNYVYSCDWKVEVLSEDFFQNTTDFQFRYKINKIEGSKTNITLIRTIEDIYGNIIKSYDNYTKEITSQHTTPYLSSDLDPGTYLIKGKIFPNCNDTDLTNNYIEKSITINGSYTENNTNNCDWQIKILLDEYIFNNSEDVNWTVKVSKNYGEKTDVSAKGYVKDMTTSWQMDYNPWTNEKITNYRTEKYSPNLWENKFYSIFYNITELNCIDTNLENNFDYKFIMILSQELGIDYTQIKINEFLPDPQGYDNALMPEGEWVELYNSGDIALDLENLSLKDNYGKEADIFISNSNTINNTIINEKSYLVVYMNGRSGFLNNDGFEKISLYKEDYLIDSVSYSDSQEGVSWSLNNNYWQLSPPSPSAKNKDNSSLLDSTLKIEEIYDLGSNKKAEPGDILRIKVEGYKGNTNKKVIDLFLEKNKEKVSKISKFNIDNKFQEYIITIPLSIPLDIEDGKYKIVVQGLETEDTKTIDIFNNIKTKKETKQVSSSTEINPSIIKTETIKSNILEPELIYESSNTKAHNLEIYFLCALLILVIITLKND